MHAIMSGRDWRTYSDVVVVIADCGAVLTMAIAG